MARNTHLLGTYRHGNRHQYLGKPSPVDCGDRFPSYSYLCLHRHLCCYVGLYSCYALFWVCLWDVSQQFWLVKQWGGVVYRDAFKLLCVGWSVDICSIRFSS